MLFVRKLQKTYFPTYLLCVHIYIKFLLFLYLDNRPSVIRSVQQFENRNEVSSPRRIQQNQTSTRKATKVPKMGPSSVRMLIIQLMIF